MPASVEAYGRQTVGLRRYTPSSPSRCQL